MKQEINKQNEYLDDEDVVSKTAVKKALQDIVLFSETLLTISPKVLAQLPLDDSIRAEIELAKSLKVNNSRRRQLQRIAKLLRKQNIDEVRLAFESLQQQDRQHQQSISPCEQWCKQLLDEDHALATFIDQHPHVERQQLGQLLRQAKKELSANKGSQKYQQRLFAFVQQALLSA